MTDPSSPAAPPARRKRVRLAPEVRRHQILDAALDAFGEFGFAGTSMHRIARGVGLSKAGLYAHFASKDEIFEALLTDHMLAPPLDVAWASDEDQSIEALVDGFLDRCYTDRHTPRVLATFRLLIAESGRVPDFVRRWHATVIAPHKAARDAVIHQAVAAGRLPRNGLTENFDLAMAPALMAMMSLLVLTGPQAEAQAAAFRAAHREILLILLDKERGCRR